MELIERYLQAVGFWLPARQKQDILAELSEDIRSQIDDKESELGRTVTDTDVEEVLKQRGSPVMVANRYQPQRSLIGPVLYPIYRLVLKMAFLFYFLPWVVILTCLSVFMPSYRVHAFDSLWMVIFNIFTFVTLTFALLEKYSLKSGFLEKWNPRKLPPLRANRIKRSSSITEIVALVIASAWWLIFMSSPVIINRPELRIVLAPAWSTYFWSVFILMLVTCAVSVANLFRPYWTVFRAYVRLLTDCVGWGLFAWLCKMDIVAEIAVRNVPAEHTMRIAGYINLWMGRSVPIIIAMGALIALFDVYRIVRIKDPDVPVLGVLTRC